MANRQDRGIAVFIADGVQHRARDDWIITIQIYHRSAGEPAFIVSFLRSLQKIQDVLMYC
jgi:hypothetical protein